MDKPCFLAPAGLLVAVIFAALSAMAQNRKSLQPTLSEPYRQASLPVLTQTWYRYWDKGYLITFGTDGTDQASPTKPSVALYDRNGSVARESIVWFKDAYRVEINDVAVNSLGIVVVAGGTESPAGVIANFIAEIDNTGHMGRVVRTTPFIPIYVCVGEDGTVWSYGFERDQEGNKVGASPMLRQYSFEKGQLRATLDNSAVDSSGWTLTQGRYLGEINLRCSSQKVGLLNGRSNEYVELDIPTGKLKVSKINPLPSPREMRITGFALTGSDVSVSLQDRSSSPPRSGIFHLSFDTSGVGSWVPLPNTVGPYLHGGPVERLLGADGDDLVYTRDPNGEAYWSKFIK